MLTTFARIAKILKGLVEPRNWVEEAFAESGSGTLILRSDENGTLDKTWQEIFDVLNNNPAVIILSNPYNIVQQNVIRAWGTPGDTHYRVGAMEAGEVQIYETNSTDGYPTLSQ